MSQATIQVENSIHFVQFYTQQKKKVNTFSSSDFSYKTFINIHKLYIKLTEI